MTITHIIKETGKELCFVNVSQDAREFIILEKDFACYKKGDLNYVTDENMWMIGNAILPQGDWTLIGLTKKIKEEQIEGIMPKLNEFEFNGTAYVDFNSTSIHDTPTESLRSLMDFMEIDSTANWVLLVKDL